MNAARPSLEAEKRDLTGKRVARLRRQGRLPAVVFGHGVASSNISVDAHEFDLFRRRVGANTLLDLVVDGGRPTPTIVYGVQVHPVSHKPLHVDLLAVRMTEELTVEVRVIATGTSVLVDRDGGTVAHILDSVKVRALPDHLPQAIEVSIDGLTEWDHAIRVRDLTIPDDAHFVTDADEIVVRVLPPRVEIEPVVEEAEGAAEGAPAEGAAGEAEGQAGESATGEGSTES